MGFLTGSEPFEVIWVHNDQEIKDSSSTRYVTDNNKQFSLVIADIFPEDSGIYTCEVYNMFGHEETSCRVHFQGIKHLFLIMCGYFLGWCVTACLELFTTHLAEDVLEVSCHAIVLGQN